MLGMTRREVRELLGARIRSVREARGLSLRELTNLSDIPEVLLGTMERGRMLIRLENLLCIARALRVPVTELFTDPDDREAEDVDE